MRSGVVVSVLLVGLSSCIFADGNIYVSNVAAYENLSNIQNSILTECNLPEQQVQLFEQEASEQGFTVIKSEADPKKGKYLKLSISDAMSSGNAFIGHSKFVTVKGILYENGAEIANFTDMRRSGGGAFGAYKSSCSVLGRCVKTIAKDTAKWLNNPMKNSRLGDLAN